MEAELVDSELQASAQLGALGLADLAEAEDLLAREEAHVAAIDVKHAQLEGLVGKEPPATLAYQRDTAALEISQKTSALEALGPIAKEPRARERLEVEVRDQESALERARDDEANARARVEANAVDAEQVAGHAERLAAWREQLAATQRRQRVFDATLQGIDRAEQATMKTATRYLEAHMVRDLATVTGGRYRRVRVDDKTLDIEVHAPEKGDWVPVRSLSQGTLDLVFLVARLGLVRLVTGDRRPPLVFDDPFVTLDDARAARALGLLKSVATDFQVIYLTTSPRYDEVADAVVLLDGPTSVDTGADPGPAGTGTPAATGSPAVAGTPAASGSPTATGSPRLNELASGQTITVVLGLLSAIVWGCGDFGGGLLTRRTALFGVVLGSQLVGMAMAFVLALVRGETAMLPADVVWSVLAGLAGGIGISGLYNGLAVGRMGVVAPITAVLAALIPVAAGILLQGVPAPLVVVGIGLAIVAVVLVSRVGDDPGRAGPAVRTPVRAHRRRRDRVVQRLRRPAQRRSRVRPAHAHPRHGGRADRGRRPRDARVVAARTTAVGADRRRRGPRHGRQRRVHPGRPGRLAGRGRGPVLALPGDDRDPGGGLPARAGDRDARGRDRPGDRGDRLHRGRHGLGPAVVRRDAADRDAIGLGRVAQDDDRGEPLRGDARLGSVERGAETPEMPAGRPPGRRPGRAAPRSGRATVSAGRSRTIA